LSRDFEIEGGHDVDSSWMEAVREGCSNLCRIYPRVILEGWTQADYNSFLDSDDRQNTLVQNIVSLVEYVFFFLNPPPYARHTHRCMDLF
jgi:hypothetical protein